MQVLSQFFKFVEFEYGWLKMLQNNASVQAHFF